MNRCPITYQLCLDKYSKQGLKLLARNLETLHDLPLTTEQLRREAIARSAKMSIQGGSAEGFRPVEHCGRPF